MGSEDTCIGCILVFAWSPFWKVRKSESSMLLAGFHLTILGGKCSNGLVFCKVTNLNGCN